MLKLKEKRDVSEAETGTHRGRENSRQRTIDRQYINIHIVDDEEYEKTESFAVELDEPYAIRKAAGHKTCHCGQGAFHPQTGQKPCPFTAVLSCKAQAWRGEREDRCPRRLLSSVQGTCVERRARR
ncbi:hypothetical protein ACOMHN_053416 [Nucella lapillus]